MGRKKVAKIIVIGVVGIVAVCGAGYEFLRLAGIIDPDACISERMQTIPNLSRAKVETVYTNCDTLAKDEAISVYFSRASVNDGTWYGKWFNRRIGVNAVNLVTAILCESRFCLFVIKLHANNIVVSWKRIGSSGIRNWNHIAGNGNLYW